MAKYNILSENDELLKKKVEEEKPEIIDSSREELNDIASVADLESEVESSETEPEPVADDIFSDDIFSTIESERKSPIDDDSPIVDDSVNQTEQFSEIVDETKVENDVDEYQIESDQIEEIEETAESEYPHSYQKPDRQSLLEDIDETQEKINYKPVIIGIGVVAVVVVIFLLVSNIFFGDEGDEGETQKVETAEERMQREQTERKQNFLSELNKTTGHKMSSVYLIAGFGLKNIKYSSILLYGNTLDLEVFARDRETLANFNLKIKNNQKIKDYSIESVDNRPGSQGGLFALYDINLNGIQTTPSASSNQVTSTSPATWASSVPNQAGLKIRAQRQISNRNENLFSISRNEYELRGSLNNCLTLIKNLAATNQNLAIHKLSLLPTDQRQMSASSYMLKLVIDFYL